MSDVTYNLLDLVGKELTLIQLSETLYTTKEWDSLRIWTDTNSWYRFSRGIGGDSISWIKYFYSDKEFNINDFQQYLINKSVTKEEIIKIYDAHALYGNKTYHEYLVKRKISFETFQKFNLEVNDNSILIPLTDLSGKRIGVQARNIVSTDPKNRYLFYLMQDKPALFPLTELKHIKHTVILCEGTFSVMRYTQVINDDNYKIFSCLGNNPSPLLPELLNRINNIICIYDPDDGGKSFKKKLSKLLPNAQMLCPNVKLDDMTDKELLWFHKNYIKS